MMLTLAVVLATLSLHVFATDTINMEINKSKIEKDELTLTVEKSPDNENEIIVDTSLQGEYYKYEDRGEYICGVRVEYKFTDEILRIFDFSIASEPDLGKITGTFEENNIIWDIGDITTKEAVHFKFKLQLKQNYDLTKKTYPLFSKLAFRYGKTGFEYNEINGASYLFYPDEKVVTDIPEITISRIHTEDNNNSNTNTDKDNEIGNNTNNSNDNATNTDNNTNTDIDTNTNNNTNTNTNTDTEAGTNTNINSNMSDNNNENTNNTNNTNSTLAPTQLPDTGLVNFLKIAILLIAITITFISFKLHQLK